jgi:hypothetical protein
VSFDLARKIADAVLYEGYMLYPYRASSVKNRVRWQFGVLAPQGFSTTGGGDPWSMQTECLIEGGPGTILDVQVRFLQVRARQVEAMGTGGFSPVERLDVSGESHVTWEEGVARTIDHAGIPLRELLEGERVLPFDFPALRKVEDLRAGGEVRGRLVYEEWPLDGAVRLAAQVVSDLVKVRVRIENRSSWPTEAPLDRRLAIRQALVGTHTLLGATDGAFVSLLDPPPSAVEAVAGCVNERTWPVLVGDEGRRDVMLSSPIILYDYPSVAPESPGDLCDSTEIDEILTLRVMTMTDEEKAEARATDERARAIIERSDSIPAEVMERLHGAIRGMKLPPPDAGLPGWESFLNPPASPSPEEASIQIGPHRVARGARVRLRPSRRADSMDFFLAGRVARVEAIFGDVDEQTHVAVSLDGEDTGEMHGWIGRFLYFSPDELEPLGDDEAERRH